MPSRSEPKVITSGLLRDWPLPVPTGGKDNRGTVLVVGGSRFTPGAVLLAGTAALRAGAGVLQLAVAASTAAALSIQVPEALVVGLPEDRDSNIDGTGDGRLPELVAGATVVAIGPGLHDIDESRALLRRVRDAVRPQTALVLDAYALGALSHEPDLLGDGDRAGGADPEPDRGPAPARPRPRRGPRRRGRRARRAVPGGGQHVRPRRRPGTAAAGGRRAPTPGWAPPAAATCWPASSPGCSPAAPSPPRPPAGPRTPTPSAGSG